MFSAAPDASALAAFGLNPEDFEAEAVEVWPDCMPAVELLYRVRTQWRMGMGGPTGLDYQVVFRLMDQAGLEGQDWDDMLDDLQAAEAWALDAMTASRSAADA